MAHSSPPDPHDGTPPRRPVDMANLLAAAELVDDLTDCSDAVRQAFAEGYRLGWGSGYDAGFAHGAEHEFDSFFKPWMYRLDHSEPHDTLQRRRYPPDGDVDQWIRDGEPAERKPPARPWPDDTPDDLRRAQQRLTTFFTQRGDAQRRAAPRPEERP